MTMNITPEARGSQRVMQRVSIQLSETESTHTRARQRKHTTHDFDPPLQRVRFKG